MGKYLLSAVAVLMTSLSVMANPYEQDAVSTYGHWDQVAEDVLAGEVYGTHTKPGREYAPLKLERDTAAESKEVPQREIGHSRVYANGRSFSCKANEGKAVSSLPDVCFSDPEPAGPVPIPYPNIRNATDTQSQNRGRYHEKEAVEEDARTLNQLKGKTAFLPFELDVKFEGKNHARASDYTGWDGLSPNNHHSPE